jgi:hypothetical protein
MKTFLALALLAASTFAQDLAVKGQVVFTSEGAPIQNGVVIVRGGKIAAV